MRFGKTGRSLPNSRAFILTLSLLKLVCSALSLKLGLCGHEFKQLLLNPTVTPFVFLLHEESYWLEPPSESLPR